MLVFSVSVQSLSSVFKSNFSVFVEFTVGAFVVVEIVFVGFALNVVLSVLVVLDFVVVVT